MIKIKRGNEDNPPDSKFQVWADGGRTRYPFSKMEIGEKVRIEGTIQELRKAQYAAHQIGTRKKWKFSTFTETIDLQKFLWVWRRE